MCKSLFIYLLFLPCSYGIILNTVYHKLLYNYIKLFTATTVVPQYIYLCVHIAMCVCVYPCIQLHHSTIIYMCIYVWNIYTLYTHIREILLIKLFGNHPVNGQYTTPPHNYSNKRKIGLHSQEAKEKNLRLVTASLPY